MEGHKILKLRQGSTQLKCLHLAGRIQNSLHRGDTNAPKLSAQMKMKRTYANRSYKSRINIYKTKSYNSLCIAAKHKFITGEEKDILGISPQTSSDCN